MKTTLGLIFAWTATASLSPASRLGSRLARRQGAAFDPNDMTGFGQTCEEAFGYGWVECRPWSAPGGLYCINPDMGHTCCENSWGCPAGSYCFTDGLCCPDGLDPETCATDYGVDNPSSSSEPPYGPSSSSEPPYGPSSSSEPPYGPSSSSEPPYGPSSSSEPPYGPSSSSESPCGPSSSSEPPYGPPASSSPPCEPSSSSELPYGSSSCELHTVTVTSAPPESPSSSSSTAPSSPTTVVVSGATRNGWDMTVIIAALLSGVVGFMGMM